MGRLSQGQKRSAAAACRDRREPGKRLARSTARQAQPQGRPARRVQRASAARPGQAGRRPGRLLGTAGEGCTPCEALPSCTSLHGESYGVRVMSKFLKAGWVCVGSAGV